MEIKDLAICDKQNKILDGLNRLAIQYRSEGKTVLAQKCTEMATYLAGQPTGLSAMLYDVVKAD